MRTITTIALTTAVITARAQTPTWSDDVACIVYSHCTTCHHPGGIADFSLTTYADAQWWHNEMRDAVQSNFMPPWPPDPNYRSLAHERVLTQAEIDIITAWADGGAPEGLPQNAPPGPVYADDPVITAPEITAIMPTYTRPVEAQDLYRCFVLPINNPTDRYITGLEVIPGNNEMVHHVLVFQDTTGEAQQLDANDPDPGYTNFGGVGVSSAKLVGIWVPGSEPYFTPAGMGIKLLANADLVIQVHYPATDVEAIDSTRVNLRLAPPGFIRDISLDAVLDHLVTITDGPLAIAPNVVDTFHAQYTTQFPVTITAIGPHSHLLGKRMKAWAVKPGNITVPLIDIPDWDFHWQGLYSFRHPIHLPTGTTLYCETVYDNTTDNEDNPNDPPQWVWLGEATTNEMMLYYFAWTIGVPADENIVVDDSPHSAHYLDCTTDFNIGMNEALVPSIEVWPSVTSSYVNVKADVPLAQVRIIDARGRVVLNEQINSSMHSVDVRTLAAGVHSIEVRTRNGAVHRSKVAIE